MMPEITNDLISPSGIKASARPPSQPKNDASQATGFPLAAGLYGLAFEDRERLEEFLALER